MRGDKMKKCVMIYNTKSGKKKSNELLPEFQKILEDKGYELVVNFTRKRGHAEKIINRLNDDVDLVISAGGDGTFNEVISGNLKRDKKLLIADLPLGSTNDIATMYGLNKSSVENLKLLLDGEIKNIDVCKINNKAFIYFAGVGSFVNVPYETPRRLKEKYGRTAYFIYALRQFNGKVKDYNIKYEVDGKKHEGKYSFIFITNSSTVAGVNDIYPDVKLDDNKFEVVLCNTTSTLKLIKIVSLLKKQDIRTIEGLTYYKTNKFKIEFDEVPEDSWCLDGEEMKHNDKKFDFHISKEVNVLLPKVNIDKLFL